MRLKLWNLIIQMDPANLFLHNLNGHGGCWGLWMACAAEDAELK